MNRTIRLMACAAIFCLTTAIAARADPIQLTGGFLVATGPAEVAPLSVTGTHGFSVTGIVLPDEGRLDIFTDCRPCQPGDSLRLGGFLGSLAFVGTAFVDGQAFQLTNGLDDPTSMLWEITAGPVLAPAAALGTTLVQVPFTLTGQFFPDPQSIGLDMVGQGIASVALTPIRQSDFPFLWNASLLHLDFEAAAATPEPASMVLLISGMAGMGWRRWRRRVA